jgi:capsular exopolysaccharide synthesis family protein
VTDRLVTLTDPRSPEAEAYRVLRTNLAFAEPEETLRTLLVTSPAAGEGATLTAANLAVVTAQAGTQVVLVDADLRRPALHDLFGVANERGLSSVLADERLLLHLPVVATAVDGLHLLPSGPVPPNPAELLGGRRLRSLVDRLLDRAVVVIFDAPPVALVTDAAALAPCVDGVLLVLTAGKSRRDQTARAREIMDNVRARVVGVVLVGAEDGGRSGAY